MTDDVTGRSIKRVVCRHGTVNSMEMVTTRTKTGYVVEATEIICKACRDELGLQSTVYLVAGRMMHALQSRVGTGD